VARGNGQWQCSLGKGGDGDPTATREHEAADGGRDSLGKKIEGLGRNIGDQSGENTMPERRGMVELTGDREIPSFGGISAAWSGSRGAVGRGERGGGSGAACGGRGWWQLYHGKGEREVWEEGAATWPAREEKERRGLADAGNGCSAGSR
jgi:hypothetical protein